MGNGKSERRELRKKIRMGTERRGSRKVESKRERKERGKNE